MNAYIDDVMPIRVGFSRFSSGAAYDPTGSPAYRVYEQTTETPILTGTLAVFDDSNTVGYYGASITLSAANGFEVGKYYTVYVSATVDSVAAGDQVAFFRVNATPLTAADVWTYGTRTLTSYGTLVTDVWAAAITAIGTGRATTMGQLLSQVYGYLFNRNTISSSIQTVYADDSSTVVVTGTTSSTDTTCTRNKMS